MGIVDLGQEGRFSLTRRCILRLLLPVCCHVWKTGVGLAGYFSKGMFPGSASCLQTTVKILKGRGNTLIFTSDTIRYGHLPLDLFSFSLVLVAYEKKPQTQRDFGVTASLKDAAPCFVSVWRQLGLGSPGCPVTFRVLHQHCTAERRRNSSATLTLGISSSHTAGALNILWIPGSASSKWENAVYLSNKSPTVLGSLQKQPQRQYFWQSGEVSSTGTPGNTNL